jgi:glycine betaine catabolism A
VTGGAPSPSGHFKGVIRCVYHSWCYELDGAVRNAPYLGEAEAFDPLDFGLHPVALDTWGGWIFVNASPERVAAGHTLAAQLGEIPARIARYPLEDLRTARREVYDVRANWKVIVENYNECYHCAGVHPELCRIVPAFRERGGSNLDWDNGVPQAEGTFTFTLTGVTDRAPFPGLDELERTRHKGELVYPNLMISLSADHVAAFALVPKGPDRTLVVVDWLFHPDEMAMATFDPSDAVDFWDLVNRQDWAVCEGVQDGMTSRRFRFGWFAPMEDMSLDIRRYIADTVGEDAVRIEEGG